MGFEKDFVVGAIVLAIALVGIVSPFLLHVSGRVSPGSGGVNATDIGSLISSIMSAVTHFKFMGFGLGSPTPVKEETINVTGPLKLNILVKGGGVSVLEWGKEGRVRIVVLKESIVLGPSTSIYEYRYANDVLNVVSAGGYVIKVYVPPNYVTALNTRISGGGLQVNVSDATTLRTINATINGGGIELRLGKLANLTAVIKVSGGGVEGHLSFLSDAGPSASSIKVSVAGGGVDIHVHAPTHAFKVTCSAESGAANVVVRGEKHSVVNGNVSYEDPNYVNVSRKLSIDIALSGGGANVWLSG